MQAREASLWTVHLQHDQVPSERGASGLHQPSGSDG